MNNELIVAIAEGCGLCSKIEGAGYKNDAFWFDVELFSFANEIATAERIELADRWEQKYGFDKYGVAEWLRHGILVVEQRKKVESETVEKTA